MVLDELLDEERIERLLERCEKLDAELGSQQLESDVKRAETLYGERGWKPVAKWDENVDVERGSASFARKDERVDAKRGEQADASQVE